MIASILVSLAAIFVMAFGGKLLVVYLSALESMGVPSGVRQFFQTIFPALRWVFAPAALALAVASYFLR